MMDFDGVPLQLPEKFDELRPWQIDAVRQIRASNRKVTFLDAPTGAGKTLIAEVMRQVWAFDKPFVGFDQAIYLCSTLSLQDQFMHDFPYARLIKGRSNYPTRDQPEKFDLWGERRLTAADCTKAFHRPEEHPICGTCDLRAIVPLDAFHVSGSLQRSLSRSVSTPPAVRRHGRADGTGN